MAIANYLAGITATATLNGTELSVTGWSVTPNATILEFINSKTGLHPVLMSTIMRLRFTLGFDYDTNNQPFAAPLSIVVGSTLTNVKLFLDGTGGSNFWNIPSALVASTPQSVAREGKIHTSIECAASGQFAAPAGAMT